jgi:predicted acylesterase/phospholipase RssA
MPDALTVSGGGSKGAFAVGAIKYLLEERDLDFDILSGTSTGALVTAMVAADGVDAVPILEREYTTAGPGSIVEERTPPASILSASSIFSYDGLVERIRTLITDDRFQRLQDSGRRRAHRSDRRCRCDPHLGRGPFSRSGREAARRAAIRPDPPGRQAVARPAHGRGG